MQDKKQELKNKDEIMFKNPINIFPGIDMSVIWSLLNSEQKVQVWLYLQLLYSAFDI